MNKRNLFVRITALVLCAIMLLGVVTAALYAFAAEAEVVAPAQTGSPDNTWIIIAVIVALLIVVACAFIPKMKKK